MKIAFNPGPVSQQTSKILTDAQTLVEQADVANDTGETDEVHLSVAAKKYLAGGTGHSVAGKARAAILAGAADGDVPFGHIVREIAHNRDAFTVAEPPPANESPAVDPDPVDPVPADTPAVPDDELVLDPTVDEDPDLAFAVQLLDDLVPDNDSSIDDATL